MSTLHFSTTPGRPQVFVEPKDDSSLQTRNPPRGGTELQMEELQRWYLQEFAAPLPTDDVQFILSRVRHLDADKKRILWLHDLPQDPEAQHLSSSISRERFAKLVFVSNWQQTMFSIVHGIPLDQRSIVVRNAVDPVDIDRIVQRKIEAVNNRSINLIYHSTPHRGLDILYDVYNRIYLRLIEGGWNVNLRVYSSFKLYGWDERDQPYQRLFDLLNQHPGIEYYGTVTHQEIYKSLEDTHIFAYPSTWIETSCRCLMEAMINGVYPIYPNLGALPETAGNLGGQYQWYTDKKAHSEVFENYLLAAVEALKQGSSDSVEETVRFFNQYSTEAHGWQNRILQWDRVLRSL